MPDNENRAPATHRMPWNKGKLIGARPPLRPKHVWSIRTRLLVEGGIRDLALFNLAIDSKLRGCDVVAIKVEDVASIQNLTIFPGIGNGKPMGRNANGRRGIDQGEVTWASCARHSARQ